MLPRSDVQKLPRPIRRVIANPGARWRRALLTPRQRRRLRHFLNEHGHVTPHFTWGETRSGDGALVPPHLRDNAIRHAWRLEEFRRKLGNPPIGILSWYRSPAHNQAVGGASQSKHMEALATDLHMPIRRPSDRHPIPRDHVMAAANEVWKVGGVGDYPSGAVHVDSRNTRARWSSF